jgi:putative MFS transporter
MSGGLLSEGGAPARFRWLAPGLRPPVAMTWRQEKTFLLVGAAAFFAGYDQNVFGLATLQIQNGLHIPENQLGLTLTYFRSATLLSLIIAASADLVGRRRLLLVTLFCQGLFTLLTAFAPDYASFVGAQIFTRVFGYAEEMLCFVVIVEEVAAGARGWAMGTLASLDYFGAGIASLLFAAVTILPYGWRALYLFGAGAIFLVAFLRRQLPETKRFEVQESGQKAISKLTETMTLLHGLMTQYPGRIAVVLIAATGFGFATAPALFMQSKYLQSIYHYQAWQTTAVFIPGGLIGLAMAIRSGRFSDRLGRKPVVLAIVALAGLSFFLFYAGVPGWAMPPLWVLSFFGFFAGDALIGGFALEIVPTQYRATVSGLRYVASIAAGALSLALEGRLYDHFGAHAPALQTLLCTIPLTLLAVLFLPEPAGKSLEEMTA